MSSFEQNKEALNRELAQFKSILDDLLPRYAQLLEKKEMSKEELTELGEIEHYLIEVNAKITAINEMLKEDLFGHSLDVYYQLKRKAALGDLDAEVKLERMKSSFQDSLLNGSIFIWN